MTRRPRGTPSGRRVAVPPPDATKKGRIRYAALGRRGIPKTVEQAAMMELEKAVGGRDAVKAALEHAPGGEDVKVLQAFLADPRNDLVAIHKLCDKANIALPTFWGLFRHGSFTRAQIAALAKVTQRLPDVAEDVMARALPYHIPCPSCAGGVAPPKRQRCARCHGTGQLLRQPDVDRQTLALEIGGLIKRGAGGGVHVQVMQQQALVVSQMPSAFAKFQQATDRILYGDGRPSRPTAPSEAVVEDGEPPRE